MPTAAYIGTVAHPIPLEWVRSTRVTTEGRHSVQRAPARSWAYMSGAHGVAPPRMWEVEMLVGNATMANIDALAAGAFGHGPFLWLPESAYVTNAISPSQSLLLGVPGSGAGVAAVEGWAPRSALGPGPTVLTTGTPVIPGEPVTVSIDASGPTVLRPVFRNAAGNVVSSPSVAASGTSMQRIHYTTSAAPSTARTVDVRVDDHTVATRPQVTWLRNPVPWSAGAGATSVVIDQLSTQASHLDARGDLMLSVTMTLQEVN